MCGLQVLSCLQELITWAKDNDTIKKLRIGTFKIKTVLLVHVLLCI